MNVQRMEGLFGAPTARQGKREAMKAAMKAEDDKPTIARLWAVYDEANALRATRHDDGFPKRKNSGQALAY
jgi:hypothetical protein